MVQIPNTYDFVADCTNANGEWLDVYCKHTEHDSVLGFDVIYVVGGTEDGGVVEAIDRYDDHAEFDAEKQWLEFLTQD